LGDDGLVKGFSRVDQRKMFNWRTYPIITKLDYQSGDEQLVGGFDELQVMLLSAEE